MQVGAWYFNGWWLDPPAHYQTGGVDWRPRFPKREPVTGWGGSTQAVMDQEILLASQNGLDFFAFDWYGPERIERWPGSSANVNNGLNFFRSSPNKAAMKFCISYVCNPNCVITDQAAWDAAIDFWIECFKDPQYLRNDHARPIIIIDAANDFHSQLMATGIYPEQFIARLRLRTHDAIGCYPLIGGCLSSAADVPQALSDGFNFMVGDYASLGQPIPPAGTVLDYQTIVDAAPKEWASFAATGVKYVPVVCSGFDRRPTGAEEGYFNGVSPMKYRELLKSAKAFTGSHPGVGLVLTYAWNERSEGGQLEPTVANGNELVRQIKAVFGG